MPKKPKAPEVTPVVAVEENPTAIVAVPQITPATPKETAVPVAPLKANQRVTQSGALRTDN